MRRRLILAGVALSMAATYAGPLLATAATTGSIRGVVVHADDDRPLGGVRVVLTGRSTGQEAEPTREVVRTDDEGRFAFEDLPTGSEYAYAVDADYDGGRFAGGALQIPDDTEKPPVLDSTLRVWDTTTDPASIVIRSDRMFVVPSEEGRVGVIESVTIANVSDEAYIGRGADDPGADPGRAASLGFALPGGATAEGLTMLEASLDVPAAVPTEYGFATTTAIPPGMNSFTFTYALKGEAGTFDLTKRALYPTLETEAFVADPLEMSSNFLQENGTEEIDGVSYARYSTDEDITPGSAIQMLATAQESFSPGLVAGIVVLVVALLAAVVGGFVVRSRRRRPPTARAQAAAPEPAPESDPDVVKAIADLDLRYKAGEIDSATWAARRAELKDRLARPAEETVPVNASGKVEA